MKNLRITKYILILPILFAALGCSDLLENPSRETNVLVPLAGGTLKIQNAVNDENKNVAADGSISILYKHTLFENHIPGSLEIGTGASQIQKTFTQSQTYNPGNFIFGQNHNAVFQAENDYRQAEFERINIEITLESNINQPAIYTISLPEFTIAGRPVKFEVELNGSETKTITETLENVAADLTGSNHTQLNSAHIILTAKAGNNTPVEISPANEVRLNIEFSQASITFARGKFKTQTHELSSNSNFAVLENFQSGTLTPQNATLDITVKNNTGLFATLDFKEITAVKTADNKRVNLNANLTQNPINLTPATLNSQNNSPENPGTFITQLTSQNSNLNAFLEILPDAFEQESQITINPRGNITAANDFLHKDFGINTRGELSLPLVLAAENLVLTEKYTLDLQEDERETTDRIIGGRLLLNAKNGYPLSAEVQGYFVNDEGLIIDSLFSEPQTVTAATTDGPASQVTESAAQQFEILLTPQRIENLYLTEKIEFKTILNTPEGEDPVPFYDDYAMHLQLAGDLTYKLDLY